MKKEFMFTLKEKIIMLFLITGVIIFQFIDVSGLGHEKDAQMITNTIIRLIAGVLLLYMLFKFGHKEFFQFKLNRTSLVMMIPALLIAINNFPIVSYFDGRAELTEPTYRVILFFIECLSVGFFEEILFRGIVLIFLVQSFSHMKGGIFLSVFVSSLIFGLFHIINFFDGATLSSTLLQMGYSFLMGMLWATLYLKTGNIWFIMILHALYNFFGQVLFYLGTVNGRFDEITVTITMLIGMLAAIQVIVLLKRNEFEIYPKVEGQNNEI